MDELVIQNAQLPTALDDLAKFALVGREKLTAVRAEIRAIERLKLADDVRAQKKEEAQYIAEVVIDAEMRIGELLKSIKAESGGDRRSENFKEGSAAPLETQKQKARETVGISTDQAKRFMKLAENRELVEQAKTEARENDDIVSRSFVLEKIKRAECEAKRRELQFTQPQPLSGKFDVIYADPPWKYDFSETEKWAVENHYPTMSLEEIKNIPIPAQDNAVLLLWTTAPKLQDAFSVISAWGFTYKTCAVWNKVRPGMGYWFLGQHELLLVATRGQFKPPVAEARVASVYTESRTQHSKKPDYYYDLIEKMFPEGRYLEMFARQKYNERWSVWGNQVEGEYSC
ncbi:hypothetical protein AGMMS49975_15840 [Clostridia bacterium]|nr:hypothetical protein AGMMS49975_15840 [Clostridia bacterium]